MRLCPADLNTTNFMKGGGDKIVALDFESTCFLPPSFFAFVLDMGHTTLTQLVARKVKYPKSTEVDALMSASYALVPYGTNEIGERIFLLSFLFLASRPLTTRLTSTCIAQLFRASSSPGASKTAARKPFPVQHGRVLPSRHPTCAPLRLVDSPE
jgi:hypothetical protein